MKKIYTNLLVTALMVWGLQVSAQKKYVDEVFAESDIEVTSAVTYATNIDFLTSKFTNPTKIFADLTAIRTALATKQPIPPSHYNPLDTSTVIKVKDIKMDVYAPKASADTTTARPVIIFVHTGNFLPPGINGTPVGYMNDSTAIYLCRQWAKRGYVAVSADYRLGWNPLASSVQARRGALLNAVYRAIHDIKRCVMALRTDAAASNTYAIDPSKIALFGEGSGAYVALAYTTMDKHAELELPKFIHPGTGKSYIDTLTVGNIDGVGGTFNLYGPLTTSVEVSASVAAGGALADTSWLEAGDAAMIGVQCIRDPFAPFDQGIVIVPTTGEDVVEVQGSNLYIMKSMALGNNDAFKAMPNDDDMTAIARTKYGKTFDYIFPSPRDKITVNANLEGLFAVDLAAGASLFQNQAQPWQWWDSTSPAATAIVAPPAVTAHQASLRSNPDMSPEKGQRYLDTIHGYVDPRLAIVFGYYTTGDFVGVNEVSKLNTSVYPNPSTGLFNIEYKGNGAILEIQVRDLNGRVMSSVISGQQNNAQVDITGLNDGYYLLELITDEGTAVYKIHLAQ